MENKKQMSTHTCNQSWVYSCHRPLCMFCSSSSSPDRLDTVVSCTHSYCTDASGGAYATHNNIKKLYPAWQVYPDIMRCVYALVVL